MTFPGRRTGKLLQVTLAAIFVLCSSVLVSAQGRFTPLLQVGDTVVTQYQLQQRAQFLTLLGAPGDTRGLAREQLINEAVQRSAASGAGIELSPTEIEAGITEFAARANLTSDQFVAALGQNGVGAETFRDFIAAGVAWRNFVRATFAEDARSTIDTSQMQRTLSQTGTEGGLRVLISEIILPANTPETAAASRARAARIASISDEEAFSTAARQFSVAPTSTRGGEINWVAIETLPEAVRPSVQRLQPGQVSQPVALENAIGVFLMRDREEVAAGTPNSLLIDYAVFTAASAADAQAVRARIDVCDDLYGEAVGLPESRLIRETEPATSLPTDLRAAVAGLDEGESLVMTRGGSAALVMLCARRPAMESTVDLEIIGNRLLNVRLGTTAANHLANLRADTLVIDLTN